jgi:hypothetical protein
VRLPTADLLSLRSAGVGLLPALLGALAVSAGLVALPGAAAGIHGHSGTAQSTEKRERRAQPDTPAAV